MDALDRSGGDLFGKFTGNGKSGHGSDLRRPNVVDETNEFGRCAAFQVFGAETKVQNADDTL